MYMIYIQLSSNLIKTPSSPSWPNAGHRKRRVRLNPLITAIDFFGWGPIYYFTRILPKWYPFPLSRSTFINIALMEWGKYNFWENYYVTSPC